jgi:hypothetical protein
MQKPVGLIDVMENIIVALLCKNTAATKKYNTVKQYNKAFTHIVKLL